MKQTMYNQQQKEEYLQTLTETERNLITPLFRKIKPIEEEYDIDFCHMNRKLIVECCRLFKRETNIRPYFSKLRKYSAWCKEVGYNKGINYCDPAIMTVNEIIKYVGNTEARYWISPEKYEEFKHILLTSPNNIYLTSLFMSCYEGIGGNKLENLINLRVKDVIDGNPVELYDGSVKNISEELRKLLIECSEIDVLTGGITRFLRHSEYHDSIWKSVRDSKDKKRKFVAAFDNVGRIKDLLGDKNVTPETLERSGLFNYMVKRSSELGYDLKTDMKSIMIPNRYGKDITPHSSDTAAKYNALLREYGSHIFFFEFKRMYADWTIYIPD